MKLSEAIREGSKNVIQIKHAFFKPLLQSESGEYKQGCCTLGAAYLACYKVPNYNLETIPVLTIFKDCLELPPRDKRFRHPIQPNITFIGADIFRVLVNLNDNYGWTFEQCAAWLESVGE